MIGSGITRVRERGPVADGPCGRREWFLVLGGVGVLLVGGIAILGPTLAPYPPGERVGQPLQPPGDTHLLGTDDVGHDLLSLLLVGARVSLFVGLLSGSLAILVGLVVGTTAGLLGGRGETVVMRTIDVVLTLPFLPLVIVAAAVLGPSRWTTIGVLASVMWARPARELRSQVLSVRQREYVRASRAMGGSLAHVGRRYVVPAVIPIVIAQFAKAVGAAILLEASLSFLGLGDPSAPSWGTILFFAQNRSAFLTDAWTWWVLPPGIAITASVLSFTFLALGVERNRGADRRSVATNVDGAEVELCQPGTAPAPDEVLTVSDLTVEYGTDPGTIAVDEVDLTLQADEVLGIVGESGSGKSSLALAVLGLLRPPGRVTSGHVTLHTGSGFDGVELADIRGDEIAFVPQEAMNALDPRVRLHEQVLEAILTHRSCGREEATETADEILETVGLPPASHDRYPHELSGGMCQRGVLAIALVNEPSVLVVDEPTTGLDVVTEVAVLGLLEELQAERGFSLVMVSHDLAAVTRIADRLAVLCDGEFVETGDTARLQSGPEHPYTEELLSARVRLPATREPQRAVGPAREDVATPPRPSDVSWDSVAPSTETASHLTYDGVHKNFAGEEVLTGVDLTVARGQSVALVGESGAGKSTLGRMAVGLVAPDRGTVRIDGESAIRLRERDPLRLGRTVHYLFQDPYGSLPPHRTVEGIVREPLDIHDRGRGTERQTLVHRALRDVGLTPPGEYASRYPTALSGGERQRVALARAIVLEPSVLVADEPTSMLDAPLQQELLGMLYELTAARDVTLLHVTHDIARASSFADRLAVLHEGHIVETADPASILEAPDHDQTRRLVEAAVTLSGGTRDRPQPSVPDS